MSARNGRGICFAPPREQEAANDPMRAHRRTSFPIRQQNLRLRKHRSPGVHRVAARRTTTR